MDDSSSSSHEASLFVAFHRTLHPIAKEQRCLKADVLFRTEEHSSSSVKHVMLCANSSNLAATLIAFTHTLPTSSEDRTATKSIYHRGHLAFCIPRSPLGLFTLYLEPRDPDITLNFQTTSQFATLAPSQRKNTQRTRQKRSRNDCANRSLIKSRTEERPSGRATYLRFMSGLDLANHDVSYFCGCGAPRPSRVAHCLRSQSSVTSSLQRLSAKRRLLHP